MTCIITLIIGGSSSGKSKYAEDLTQNLSNKIYIATMKPNKKDNEQQNKILAHKNMRKDKNFETLECYTCSMITSKSTEISNKDVILLECMSNLLANEMFVGDKFYANCSEKILDTITNLSIKTNHIIIVSNDIFHNGAEYDEFTLQYIKELGIINQRLALLADEVVEVVFAIPIKVKGC